MIEQQQQLQRIAIFDLDRTLLRRPTFTAFLSYAAATEAPHRLAFAPLWLLLLIGYKLKLYHRKRLKQWGIALFVGRTIPADKIARLASGFADSVVPHDVPTGAAASLVAHRETGDILVIATAAPEFYVTGIARRLEIDEVVATRHEPGADGSLRHIMAGENCYGDEKLARVRQWLAAKGLERDAVRITAYSDHLSDAPLLAWADRAVIVTGHAKTAAQARRRGWETAVF